MLTSRATFEVPANQRFEVPSLTNDEIVAWATTLRGDLPSTAEIAALVSRSGGSPLYLRFFALGAVGAADLSLRDLEIRAVQALPARAKEITSYLALSDRRVSVADLEALLGIDEGPEAAHIHPRE